MWKRNKAIIALVATAIVCLGLGGISSASKADEADKRAEDAEAAAAEAEDRADAAEDEVVAAETRADSAEAEAQEEADAIVAEGEAANAARSAELDARSAELDTRSADLDAREAAVAGREQTLQATLDGLHANTFGDGIYQVGRDIQPGTYHTNGGSCYYALLSAPSGGGVDHIIDNNNIDGPATIHINSPFFESSGPCEWTKVG